MIDGYALKCRLCVAQNRPTHLNLPDSAALAVPFFLAEVPQTYRFVVKVCFSHAAGECDHTHSVGLLQGDSGYLLELMIFQVVAVVTFEQQQAEELLSIAYDNLGSLRMAYYVITVTTG